MCTSKKIKPITIKTLIRLKRNLSLVVIARYNSTKMHKVQFCNMDYRLKNHYLSAYLNYHLS